MFLSQQKAIRQLCLFQPSVTHKCWQGRFWSVKWIHVDTADWQPLLTLMATHGLYTLLRIFHRRKYKTQENTQQHLVWTVGVNSGRCYPSLSSLNLKTHVTIIRAQGESFCVEASCLHFLSLKHWALLLQCVPETVSPPCSCYFFSFSVSRLLTSPLLCSHFSSRFFLHSSKFVCSCLHPTCSALPLSLLKLTSLHSWCMCPKVLIITI